MSRPPAVARVLERVTATARKHEMFLPGQRVLVACSGGPDSVCLLYSLYQLRRLFRIKLEVFHLDHRLRPDSATDAAYVRRLADRLRLPFHLETVEQHPPRGESVEAWARTMRILHAGRVRRAVDAACIAEGHTLDDQAETVLISLIRGGGLAALDGIAPKLGYEVQPLLYVRREETEAFCRALRLRPRLDPTNLDTRLLRNAVRLKVIPQLEHIVGRDVRATMARTTDLLREDERYLLRQALDATGRLVEEVPDGIRVDAGELLHLPRAIASRVLLQVLYRVRAPLSREAVDALMDLAEGRPGRRRDLGSGLLASRDREYILVSRTSPESRG